MCYFKKILNLIGFSDICFFKKKFDRQRRYVRPTKSGANCQIVKLSDHALRACYSSLTQRTLIPNARLPLSMRALPL